MVYLVFRFWHYSEEDHETDVLRVFRSEHDANSFCASLLDSRNGDSFDCVVVPYEVF